MTRVIKKIKLKLPYVFMMTHTNYKCGNKSTRFYKRRFYTHEVDLKPIFIRIYLL